MPSFSVSTEPRTYIVVIATLACLGASVSTLEWLHCRDQLKDDGLFSWTVIGSRNATLSSGLLGRCCDRLLSFRPFVVVLIVRFVTLLALPISLEAHRGSIAALTIVILSSLLLHLRSPWGMDGSDQMLTQVFGALFLSELAGSPLAYKACLWYIAGQSCLSYLTAGVAKAWSPHWHGTNAVFAIFNTRTYGYEPAARFLLRRPRVTKVLTWGAVVMECAFSLALIVGFPGSLIFVAWGFSFHVMNAVVMGLNSFFWAFVSTYPAVIYCSLVFKHLAYS